MVVKLLLSTIVVLAYLVSAQIILCVESLKQAPVTLHTTQRPIVIPLKDSVQVMRIGGNDDDKSFPQPKDASWINTKQQGQGCRDVRYRAQRSGEEYRIVSPNWPREYPAGQNCTYYFSAPTRTQFSISCDINIACPTPRDYLYWSLVGSERPEDFDRYCGQGRIDGISTGNRFFMGFRSVSGQRQPSRMRYRYSCRIQVVNAQGPDTTETSPPTTTPAPVIPPPDGKCSCGVRNLNVTTRIVGGTVTKAHSLPWRVTVFIYDTATGRGGFCGGTIINRNYVMTAAHCTMNYKRSDTIAVYTEAQDNPVTIGDGTRIISTYFVQHPAFNKQNLDNDISLIYLSTPLTFSSKVGPACLPFGALATSDHAGTRVIASGWGTTQPVPVNTENKDQVSDTLLEVELPVLTTAECRRFMSLTNNQFCTYLPGKDTCQGDSGGSIDYQHTNGRFYCIGVTSFGYGCAQRNYPGAYTKVNNYLSWIQTTTGQTFCQP